MKTRVLTNQELELNEILESLFRIHDEKMDKWEDFLRANPEKAKKYYDKCQNFNSSKKRWSYLRLKFAKKINNLKFSDFSVSASELLLRLEKVVSENQ
jgi:hypothetical protein